CGVLAPNARDILIKFRRTGNCGVRSNRRRGGKGDLFVFSPSKNVSRSSCSPVNERVFPPQLPGCASVWSSHVRELFQGAAEEEIVVARGTEVGAADGERDL